MFPNRIKTFQEGNDLIYMKMALELAVQAFESGETPVGAVVLWEGRVVGRGFNRVELDKDPSAHAEIIAVREAAKNMGDWRLNNASIYVTLEPCVMCVGAILHARIPKLIYGARNLKWGAVGSLFDLSHDPRINHEMEVVSGLMEQESTSLLQQFYRTL